MKMRVDLRVHARFDRAGRGWADAPVGRACGEPAAHTEHGALATLRHSRERRSRGPPRSSAPTVRRALLFTRQNVPFQKRDAAQIAAIRRGGYVLADWTRVAPTRRDHRDRVGGGARDGRARGARQPKASACASCRCPRRAVSIARTRLSRERAATRRAACRGRGRRRRDGWRKYVGAATIRAAVVGLDSFGESAPARRCSSISASRWSRRRPCGRVAKQPATAPLTASPGKVAALASIGQHICHGEKHDDQDRHQRLRPHRPHGPARRSAGLSATSKWSASTTCSSPTISPTCCSTTRCTAASRARRGRRQHAGRQRQARSA